MFLSRPAFGKHVSFDGRFLHAAPGELSLWADSGNGRESQTQPPEADGGSAVAAVTQAAQRVSFLVNLWLNWQVMSCVAHLACLSQLYGLLNNAD